MSEPFIAEIKMFGCNFNPRGWAFCDGALLSIAQNTALFSILGTTYGGDGRTTLGLPDLRGRAAMHEGNGPGLSSRRLGEKGGIHEVSLNAQNLPAHNHIIMVNNSPGNTGSPVGATWAKPSADRDQNYYNDGVGGTFVNTGATNNTGGGLPHNNMMPYLAVNFCIALTGTYPSRS